MSVLQEKNEKKWTKDGKSWYFIDRYKIGNVTKQYKSALFELKRDAKTEEANFLTNPIEYIKNHSKRAKNSLKLDINVLSNDTMALKDYLNGFFEYELSFNKEATAYEYKSALENHILNELGNLEPKNIDLKINQQWHDNLDKKINPKTGQLYSTETKNKIFSALKEFYLYLVKKGVLETNYAEIIKGFKNPSKNKNEKKKIKFQTIDEFNSFMSIVDDKFWYAFFNFAFWHGCRMGEQRALKIKDIDLDKETVYIHNTFSKSKVGGEIIGSIKNNQERTILLASQSKDYISQLIDFYKELPEYSDDWFLFGGPIKTTKNRIDRALKYYYDKLINEYKDNNINILTHHEFGRHSHASHLLNKGFYRPDIYRIIALRLGDTEEVIKSTYAHPYEDVNNDKIKEILI